MNRPCRFRDPLILRRARQVVTVTLASLALSGPAPARPPRLAGSTPPPPLPAEPQPTAGDSAFLRADTNKDGQLSKDEASRLPAVAARFEQIDRDGNGFISLEEFLSAGDTDEAASA